MEGFPPFTISIRNGRPIQAWNPIRISPLVPIDADTWFARFDWLTMKAERDASGRISGFTATAPWAEKPMKVTRQE